MSKIFLILALHAALFGQIADCTKIFEERKSELQREVELIDEARQSFEALRSATNTLFTKQEQDIAAQKVSLEQRLAELNKLEEDIKKQIEENRALLELIDNKKEDKIKDTYAKMKDASAALIMEAMEPEEAASILFTLPPKKVSQIMGKMTPAKASEITLLLTKGPPFLRQN